MINKKKKSYLFILFLLIVFMPSYNLLFKGSKATATFLNINSKIIYLTFDDGPSSVVTNDILNILKQQKVKATFFVVGNRVKGREAILKRIYNEGHSIGLHTYSHDHKKIYASQDAFISEMVKTSEEIKKVVGIQPNIIRFPYGSKPHLNTVFLKKLHDHNFKIYDWNASINDGIKPYNSPELLTREAITTSNGKSHVVLLMHCNNANINTFKALPKIISYYKKLGYQFKTITNNTPEFYWHPSN